VADISIYYLLMYHKTSNKSFQRLFVHLTESPPVLIRDLVLIGGPAFISIMYKWQNHSPQIKVFLSVDCRQNTCNRQSEKLMLIIFDFSQKLQILSTGNGIHSCMPIICALN